MPSTDRLVPAQPSARAIAVRWMNVGHALVLRGDAAALAAALDAYGEAVALLRGVARGADAAVDNSLGAALMNRGQLLHRLRGTAGAGEALACLDEAESALAPVAAPEQSWPRRNLAGTRLNRANLRLDLDQPAHARRDAEAALALVARAGRDDVIDAELALKARRALCDAIGRELPTFDAVGQDALAAHASDVVDDALDLCAHWAGRGEARFSALALRFVRFGAGLYRRHQPQFLLEFLREAAAAAPAHAAEIRQLVHETLEAALADGAQPGHFALGDAATERALAIRRDLTAARAAGLELSPLT